MAAANPYTGQQGSEWYAVAWDQGYAHGQQNPGEDQPSPPSDFPPLDVGNDYLAYMQQVWSEGQLAGRADGAAGGPPGETKSDQSAARVQQGLPESLQDVTDEQRTAYLGEPEMLLEQPDSTEVDVPPISEEGAVA
jgi:hypothetical protein